MKQEVNGTVILPPLAFPDLVQTLQLTNLNGHYKQKLKLIYFRYSVSSIVVEHMPHHPKVHGLSPATAAGCRRVKMEA